MLVYNDRHMEKTIRLFDQNAYETTFEGKLLQVRPMPKPALDEASLCPNDHSSFLEIVLQQTLFFPESGGQSSDVGTLLVGDKIGYVYDVQIKEDIIYHYLSCECPDAFSINAIVSGEIDFTHRFSNMQQHTGEHIFSGLVFEHFGYDNVGFHLSNANVTMDYNGKLSKEDCRKLERMANEVIAQNIPVEIAYPSETELASLSFRSKLDLTEMGDVRIVTIPSVDTCACCATHVNSTAEVGILKVKELTNYKNGVRLHILCGLRALEDYKYLQDVALASSQLLSAPIADIPQSVERLQKDIQDKSNALKEAQASLLKRNLEDIPADTINPYIFTDLKDETLLRDSVNELVKNYDGYCLVFSGNDTDGYRFIIGIKDGDATKAASVLRTHLSAKGGGSPKMVQGQVQSDKATIVRLLTENLF